MPAEPASSVRPRYLTQDSPMTLAQGLDEYHSLMPDLIDAEGLEGQGRELFRNHDLAHVVFGCDISYRMEGMIDTWTLFGSDVGWRNYLAYLRVPEAQKIFKDVDLWRGIRESASALPDLARVVAHARRMRAKWPWRDHARFMQRPLNEIREELGIELVP